MEDFYEQMQRVIKKKKHEIRNCAKQFYKFVWSKFVFVQSADTR